MIKEIRQKFNQEFTDDKYKAFIKGINDDTNNSLDFRLSETPLFISRELTASLVDAVTDICKQLKTPEFREYSKNAVPEAYIIPNESVKPVFLQIDYAVCQQPDGSYLPQLIELQGFPTLYFFQHYLDLKLREYFNILPELTPYFSGYDSDSYIKLMREVIVGDSDPENVILMEIEPEKQKTRIDFWSTEKMIGVKPICITEIHQRGRKLHYHLNGREIPIEKIYNRVIFDEVENKTAKFNFNYKDDLDVEWVGHPNWFFRISKYSIPFFKSKYAAPCYFLKDLKEYPADLENYVLKPLFSFAGSGVVIDVTREELDKIKNPENYILQRKVTYAPLIQTPDEYAKVEVRMMTVWLDDMPLLVNNLVRMSKGKMMGVDFNKNKTWIGASLAYHF